MCLLPSITHHEGCLSLQTLDAAAAVQGRKQPMPSSPSVGVCDAAPAVWPLMPSPPAVLWASMNARMSAPVVAPLAASPLSSGPVAAAPLLSSSRRWLSPSACAAGAAAKKGSWKLARILLTSA